MEVLLPEGSQDLLSQPQALEGGSRRRGVQHSGIRGQRPALQPEQAQPQLTGPPSLHGGWRGRSWHCKALQANCVLLLLRPLAKGVPTSQHLRLVATGMAQPKSGLPLARPSPATIALAAGRDVLHTAWMLSIGLPVSVVRTLVDRGLRGPFRGDLLSLQTAVGVQRRLQHAVQLCMVLLHQILGALPQPLTRQAGKPAAQPAPLPVAAAAAPAAAGPSRAAVVLNELRCSQGEMVALAHLVHWCVLQAVLLRGAA